MTPRHHPEQALLVEYASGSLPEPLALLVATHGTLCPGCRRDIEQLEAVGGVLLEQRGGEAAVSDSSLEAVLARLDAPWADETRTALRGDADPTLPRPLRDYLPGTLDELAWHRATASLSDYRLLPDFPRYRTRLMSVSPEASMPQHTHEGVELTLVLTGTMIDDGTVYARGDVAVAGPEVDHRPMAGPGEQCICLAVTDAPVRLSGRFTRLLNPFVDF